MVLTDGEWGSSLLSSVYHSTVSSDPAITCCLSVASNILQNTRDRANHKQLPLTLISPLSGDKTNNVSTREEH